MYVLKHRHISAEFTGIGKVFAIHRDKINKWNYFIVTTMIVAIKVISLSQH